jgi:hypothetical protein
LKEGGRGGCGGCGKRDDGVEGKVQREIVYREMRKGKSCGEWEKK